MNLIALNALIAWLKGTDDDHWNMSSVMTYAGEDVRQLGAYDDWVPELVEYCDTAGCFAGHCVLMQVVRDGKFPRTVLVNDEKVRMATQFLGLNEDRYVKGLKDWLFFPHIDYAPDNITRTAAIKVLEHIRDKGELHWKPYVAIQDVKLGDHPGLRYPVPVTLV